MILISGEIISALQKIIDGAVENGEECGCQLAVYQNGRLTVDIVSGYTDETHKQKVTGQTLFPVFSVGKGIATTAFHRLVEKGVISYDQRVSDIWPEYGCNGKEDTLVWHILSHRAALVEMPKLDSMEQLADWDFICGKLAEMAPSWKPGTLSRYHGNTYGWLLGEVAHRADGRPFKQIIQEEVIDPLKLDSLFWGMNDESDRRFAGIDVSESESHSTWHTETMHNKVLRHGFIPSWNACANARNLARHYASLIDDVDGIRLLKPETVINATKLCRDVNDPALPPPQGTWARFGLGYVLYGPETELGNIFGHGGALGSEAFADRKNHFSLAFTKNHFTGTHPVHPVRDKISQVLGLSVRHW